MRKREAYGILLSVIGLATVAWLQSVGLIALFTGLSLIIYGFFKTRVHY